MDERMNESINLTPLQPVAKLMFNLENFPELLFGDF